MTWPRSLRDASLRQGIDGKLTALSIDIVEQTSRMEEHAEQPGVSARMMYAVANRRTAHRLAALDVPGRPGREPPGRARVRSAPEWR